MKYKIYKNRKLTDDLTFEVLSPLNETNDDIGDLHRPCMGVSHSLTLYLLLFLSRSTGFHGCWDTDGCGFLRTPFCRTGRTVGVNKDVRVEGERESGGLWVGERDSFLICTR